MFSQFSAIFFFVLYVNGLSRTKRTDIDLQTCIANFDIHKDKIIRTQDSQNMGAKYLTEVDLGTVEECLRLCCETSNCDVFVLEEKNSGGCYLFHCGPPEDFKCKFTHHVNYSSAVLAVNRHSADLVSQIKMSKHEDDLNKLRRSDELLNVATTLKTTTTSMKAATEVKLKSSAPVEVRKCSRYQFECHSTNECIAIYNACDGIPQCADGSDEAPELGCPATVTTTASPTRINNLQSTRYDNNLAQPLRPLPPVLPQLPEDSYAGVARQDVDFMRPSNQRLPYDPLQYGPMSLGNWGVQQPGQIGPPLPPYSDKNSHIFNHKESGLQLPDGQEISQLQYVYDPKINYYNYRQPVQRENWPNPPNYQVASPNTVEIQKVEKTQKATTTAPSPPSKSPRKIENKIKIEKHAQSPKQEALYKFEDGVDVVTDDIPETASGAVLSLTLGLIITCIMAILIGCRLRVRRRLRKCGKSYAHDADYLVNGMYL